MPKRRPQINFQVNESMKALYEESRLAGHWVTRFCAAGFLLMVEDAVARQRALNRLREWEAQYDDAAPADIRAFVQGVEDAMSNALQESRQARRARSGQKKAKRR